MDDKLIKQDQNGLIELWHNGSIVPLPFSRDIFLFDTFIAGTSYIKDIENLADSLQVNERVDFFREPDNEYDPNAIIIKNKNGKKIGYIPKKDNPVFSRLMDAGKLLFGKISNVSKKGSWFKINLKVFLHDE